LIANVIHSNLNGRGGSERLAISTISALARMNHFDVHLSTLERPDPMKLMASFGQSVLGLFQEIKKIKIWQSLQKVKLSNSSSVLTVNTHGDLVPFFHRSMKKTNSIIYCHFPVGKYSIDAVDPVYLRFIRRHDILTRTRASRIRHLSLLKNNYIQMIHNSTVLTNSEFSRNEIWKRFKVPSTVLSPPVDVDKFRKAVMLLRSNRQQKNTILVVSRINPSKRLENAIRIASLLKRHKIGDRMIIVGNLPPDDFPYYTYLNRMVKEYELERFVKFETNAGFEVLLDLMRQAKVYLHPLPGEPFGISTVEAMSAGLIAVVPDIGGHTEFVPRKYQFHTLGEGVEAIVEGMLASESERILLSDSVRKFSVTSYIRSFQKIVNDLLKESSSIEEDNIISDANVPIPKVSSKHLLN
jgi:alpha-1,2-mannosyltransferase